MIQRLRIENFAIIRQLEVWFEPGLTVITGETGAGKSIIIDALGLVLGDRATISMIRQNEAMAVIEGDFIIDLKDSFFADWQQEWDIQLSEPSLLIRRELYQNGKSRAFVNDAFVAQQALKALGQHLVEMHGQHEHQRLLDENSHQFYFDATLQMPEPFAEYSERYREFISTLQALKTLEKNRETWLKEQELRHYHYEELKIIDPQPGELEALEQERDILENVQLLADTSHAAADQLYENDESLNAALTEHIRALEKAQRIDPGLEAIVNDLKNAQIAVSEAGRLLVHYRDSLDHDGLRLEWVIERLSAFYSILRKYHKTYGELVDYYIFLADENRPENDYDFQIKKLKKMLEGQRTALTESAKTLHSIRMEAGLRFNKAVEIILHSMGMIKAKFRVTLQPLPPKTDEYLLLENKPAGFNEHGCDNVTFHIITNPGEDFKPLRDIASGGEISRIMLALKSILSDIDRVPTLIFDEADAGVSGRIARTVGEQIRRLSRQHQVFCITHLPQIASLGDHHFLVDKLFSDVSAETTLTKVTDDERVAAIARLLEADRLTESTLQTARELLSAK